MEGIQVNVYFKGGHELEMILNKWCANYNKLETLWYHF